MHSTSTSEGHCASDLSVSALAPLRYWTVPGLGVYEKMGLSGTKVWATLHDVCLFSALGCSFAGWFGMRVGVERERSGSVGLSQLRTWTVPIVYKLTSYDFELMVIQITSIVVDAKPHRSIASARPYAFNAQCYRTKSRDFASPSLAPSRSNLGATRSIQVRRKQLQTVHCI
jgi:hypothetical protein